jgi:NAD(P)-dependent dehydrogenase (short-subunit alcohol dehydrogenase family)
MVTTSKSPSVKRSASPSNRYSDRGRSGYRRRRRDRAAGGEAVAHHGDIGDAAVGTALVERALDTWRRLDIVINNAGFGRPRVVSPPPEWKRNR